MTVSVFSLVMSLLLGTVFILVTHLFRHCKTFVTGFGVPLIMLMYGICVLRMVLPVEFPWTVPVGLTSGYAGFFETTYFHEFYVGIFSVSLFEVACWIWLAGILVNSFVFICRYFGSRNKVRARVFYKTGELYEALEAVTGKKNSNIDIFYSDCVESPMGVGIFRKMILLPAVNYSKKQLHYILLHEVAHFHNHDTLLQVATRCFCCFFWWNPAVYLLRRDIEEIIEIRCDLTVTKSLSRSEKKEYLDTILWLIKNAGESEDRITPNASTPLFHNVKEHCMVERFRIVAAEKKCYPCFCRILLTIVFLCLFLLSYSFILQPAFDPPVADYSEDGVGMAVDTSDSYILQERDGTFYLVLKSGEKIPLQDETLDVLCSAGYRIISSREVR